MTILLFKSLQLARWIFLRSFCYTIVWQITHLHCLFASVFLWFKHSAALYLNINKRLQRALFECLGQGAANPGPGGLIRIRFKKNRILIRYQNLVRSGVKKFGLIQVRFFSEVGSGSGFNFEPWIRFFHGIRIRVNSSRISDPGCYGVSIQIVQSGEITISGIKSEGG